MRRDFNLLISFRSLAAPLLALGTLVAAAETSPAPILLFCGTGSSPNDVAAIEQMLRDHQLYYKKANSAELDSMSLQQLKEHRLLIVPGGNYIEMGQGLAAATTANIRQAVEEGVNYLGICAGALLAGKNPTNSFNLTDGVRFVFYSVVNQGIHNAAVPVTGADGAPIEHYWEDGPQLSGWGKAVGMYPDGTPATSQGKCGRGFVLLTGVHPEAPENWRVDLTFSTPTSASHAYAATLIEAALKGAPLPEFEE